MWPAVVATAIAALLIGGAAIVFRMMRDEIARLTRQLAEAKTQLRMQVKINGEQAKTIRSLRSPPPGRDRMGGVLKDARERANAHLAGLPAPESD